MKNIKYILIVIAVFAVVSSALAFKAKQTQYLYVHSATDPVPNRCTLQVFAITTNPLKGNRDQTLASTTALQVGCKTIDVYDGE